MGPGEGGRHGRANVDTGAAVEKVRGTAPGGEGGVVSREVPSGRWNEENGGEGKRFYDIISAVGPESLPG